jgi:hypothetical protein
VGEAGKAAPHYWVFCATKVRTTRGPRAELKKYGFLPGNYQRIIVTWDATPQAKEVAKRHSIDLWDFRDLLRQIAAANKDHTTYFTDDTARTIQLFAMAVDGRKSIKA